MARNGKSLVDRLFCEDAAEGARWGLLALMTGLSEACWCAGWMDGLETALWRLAAEGGGKYGMGEVTPRQAMLLDVLAAEAGGWWAWPDGFDDGPVFVAAEAWEKMRGATG